MNNSREFIQSLSLPAQDSCIEAGKKFEDQGQYRIEIPSTEGPEAFDTVLKAREEWGLPIHRISQGSGIQMLSDGEIREMAQMGRDNNIEVCLFTMPRANFDTGGMWNAPAGKVIQWQSRGMDQIRYALDEIQRAVDLGIRSVLLADWGLIHVVNQLRENGQLPQNLHIKSSAVMAPANPATARLMEKTGVQSINVATDLTISQMSAIRQAVDAPMDVYIEAPDGLGGFVRHHETPDIIRYGAPVYVKLGLRNSPDIYPAGSHMKNQILELSRERVRRSKFVYDLVQREYPEAVISPVDKKRPGIPEI